jgi:hypothetical protein
VSIILATQEAEIRRNTAGSQPWQIVSETLSRKTLHKSRAGGKVQDEGPVFKPGYHKKSGWNRFLPKQGVGVDGRGGPNNVYTSEVLVISSFIIWLELNYEVPVNTY